MTRQVALVTGASRGIGKGVALALGAAGFTVYLTGRTQRGSDSPATGSIDETAEQVIAAGGDAVPVVCDHGDDVQVASLFSRICSERQRLDLLVNNATTLPRALVGDGGFWERSLELADMFDVGLRSAYVASWYAAKIMVPQRRGLIVSISFYGAVSYFHGPAYGAQKAGVDKMMFDMAADLRPHGVSALSLWPGRVRTEAIVQRWQGTPEGELRLKSYEHPLFTGAVIAALAKTPEIAGMSGRSIIAAEYAAQHGITDIDGKQPASYRDEMGAPPIYFQAAN